MTPEEQVVRWLAERDVAPHMVRSVAALLAAGVPEARLARTTFTPSLRVRLHDTRPGRRLSLAELLRAAREDRLDRLEVR